MKQMEINASYAMKWMFIEVLSWELKPKYWLHANARLVIEETMSENEVTAIDHMFSTLDNFSSE